MTPAPDSLEPPVWSCPLCGAPLERGERSYACPERHSFDIAREGYVNLLLPQHKASREPGDGKAMIRARRRFLERGHYAPLAERLTTLLGETLPEGRRRILDAGCGEGYYARRLCEGLAGSRCWGVDISKPAIQCAARHGSAIHYAVAGNHHLPLADGSLDAILRVFAPGDAAEFRRVLTGDGLLVTATPGPRHLYGLKRLIYDEPKEHAPEPEPEGFRIERREPLQYPLRLESSEEVLDLLLMTPYYWNINLATRKRIEEQQELETELDFLISLYRPA